MIDAEYREALLQAHALRLMAKALPLDTMIDAIRRADSTGAILDPTAYRTKSKPMHEDLEVLEALRRLARLGPP